MHGFIVEKTKKHHSFVKKIAINLSIVVVLLSGFGLYTYGTETLDTSLVSAKKLLPFSVDIATPVQGGDIIIAPPKITPPKLPILQGELPLQENIAAWEFVRAKLVKKLGKRLDTMEEIVKKLQTSTVALEEVACKKPMWLDNLKAK